MQWATIIEGRAAIAALEPVGGGRVVIGVVPATRQRVRISHHQAAPHAAVDLDLHRMVLALGSSVFHRHRRSPGSAELLEERLAGAIRADDHARIDICVGPRDVCAVTDVSHFGRQGSGQRPLVGDVPRMQLPHVTRFEKNAGEFLREQRAVGHQDAVRRNRHEGGGRNAGGHGARRREAVWPVD